MQLYCTRPGCSKPTNFFTDLDDPVTLKAVQQKFCTNCGMPLILRDRYLPTKLLGRGGFGAAFLARDRDTPSFQYCVVKQFQPSGQLTPSQLQTAQALFEREAEVLERLGRRHPQIPDLFAHFPLIISNAAQGTTDKFFYLVQEYVDGQTLEELHQKGKFSEAEMLEVLEQTLKILQFVHENGSIHRDIKPSNIVRDCNGQLFLLDFGAVKYVTKTAGGSNSSTGIYSLGYAPPEQVSGNEVYPSTDLYALAVTCIMLLTGKEPSELFDAYSNSWKWRNYAQTTPHTADVLDKMLLATPSQRFQSAKDVLDVLVAKPVRVSSHSPIAVNSPPVSVPSALPPVVQPGSSGSAVSAPGSYTSPPASTPAVPVRRSSPLAPFSTLELLGGAAFTGFEGALLAIALFSLPLPSPISAGLWLVLSLGLVFAQARRIIERIDLLIIAAFTLGVIGVFPTLHAVVTIVGLTSGVVSVMVLAAFGGLTTIAVTAMFRLIYKLLTRLF
jgi:serine/threonine protein kinase